MTVDPARRPRRIDYFGDVADQTQGQAAHDLVLPPASPEPQLRGSSAWRRMFKLSFVGCSVWFAWQYQDLARYSFTAAAQPLDLGDVTTLTPDLIAHNSYVCVTGISEHRGMTQKVSRVLGEGAKPYWYFRLMGSRGVFVEVPPDATRFGTTQRLRVCGRAVDPVQSPTFHKLIAAYETLFATEVRLPVRIIEAEMLPSEHRSRYALGLLGLTAAIGLQMWILLRSARP